MTRHITLVGDGIANPWNARTMIDAAGMFGGACLFRDHTGLLRAWGETGMSGPPPGLLSREELVDGYAPIIVLDNVAGASEVFGFRLPRGARPALVAGNERRGVAPDIQRVATCAVQIPMASRGLNCLNVAAACAVALYSLHRGGGAAMTATAYPQRRRPELLLLGVTDHVELGSTIRSAGAFGWERVLVEDRAAVWFGTLRAPRTEGRAAARQHRNPIRVVPAAGRERFAFEEVCVVTTRRTGVPLHRAVLARGPRQLVAVPDENAVAIEDEDWGRLGRAVRFVHPDLPVRDQVYRYRLIATIALAEVARQVGRRLPSAPRLPRRAPAYDSAVALLDSTCGETVWLEDLQDH